jgi:S1-C subfamily serine protease
MQKSRPSTPLVVAAALVCLNLNGLHAQSDSDSPLSLQPAEGGAAPLGEPMPSVGDLPPVPGGSVEDLGKAAEAAEHPEKAPAPKAPAPAPTEPAASAPATESTAAVEPANADPATLRRSVVRISVVEQSPDYTQPWNPGDLGGGTGSGFLIEGDQILTNAHVVSNARLITVERQNDPRKYEAKVKFIAHDCDLAIIEVLDDSFLNGMQPLGLGDVPKLDSTVSVFGYPLGGDRISITRGVVSRIDFQRYSHSNVDLHLAIQIDAAINPGNSGGPVLQDGRVVGVAFQGYSGDVAQGIGFMIPTPVIARFIQDVKDGKYDNYVDLSISHYPLINPALRRALGLPPGEYGVLVTNVYRAGACYGILKENDVLLEMDGLPIYSDGSVEIEGERVDMAEVVERKFAGDSVKLLALREGKEVKLEVKPNSPWPVQIQANRYGVQPQFIVFGGMIFQPLSMGLLRSRTITDTNIMYNFAYFVEKEIYRETPEIVIFSGVLPDPINTFFAGYANSIVEEVNGKKIRTLSDVSAAFKQDSEYYVIKLVGHGRPIVLEKKAVDAARKRILKNYGIRKEEFLGDSIVPEDVLKSAEKQAAKTDAPSKDDSTYVVPAAPARF